MSAGAVVLDVAGTQLWLRPDGTVWCPDQATLFAADLHLGKGAAFRAQGQPVPAGRSAETLAHLDAAAHACGAARLVLLGDLWHHASGLSDELHHQLGALVQRWPTTLVLGNHDLPLAKRALQGLPITACTAPLVLGPLLAQHEPDFAGERAPAASAGFGLAGHLHPAVHLGGRGGDRLRRPCFLHYAGGLVLPAFGRWTGAWAQWPRDYAAAGARVAVVGETQVQWLPSALR
ncbi:MAG: ligase-associated DNA damage response endonuclease PdeM [Polaromonas sp.]|nr:ligase-associated DNA damage response endonuclease PdeM [Polaromonas sp.]